MTREPGEMLRPDPASAMALARRWGADTVIALYDTDGSTQLAQDDNGGEGVASRLEWTPSQAGSYYVQVRSAVCSVRCGATYKLRIARDVGTIYLPLILRGQ